MTKDEVINILKEYLSAKAEIFFAYIFGSFIIKDKYRDIDIAIYIDNKFDFQSPDKYRYGYEAEILGELSLLLRSDKIDLVILNKADLLLFHQVIKRSELIVDRNRSLRIDIENCIRKEYIDTEHLRKIKSHYLKKSLEMLNV
jgi:hypothetical protein